MIGLGQYMMNFTMIRTLFQAFPCINSVIISIALGEACTNIYSPLQTKETGSKSFKNSAIAHIASSGKAGIQTEFPFRINYL